MDNAAAANDAVNDDGVGTIEANSEIDAVGVETDVDVGDGVGR